MTKKFIFILLSVCLWGSVSAQTQLKIMSFNIHAGYDAPMADIAAFIKAQDPDIVALQEVVCSMNWLLLQGIRACSTSPSKVATEENLAMPF